MLKQRVFFVELFSLHLKEKWLTDNDKQIYPVVHLFKARGIIQTHSENNLPVAIWSVK